MAPEQKQKEGTQSVSGGLALHQRRAVLSSEMRGKERGRAQRRGG